MFLFCLLICVTDKPDIVTSENESKTASSTGMSAKLRCRAVGAPAIQMTWERDGNIVTSPSEKYVIEQRRVNIHQLIYSSS